MSRFYLVRHGECDLGEHCLLGRTDVSLNSKGLDQAQKLALKLREVQFDRIVSSPVKRALQTAECVAQYQQKALTVDDSFQEIAYGEWTKKSFDELNKEKSWEIFNKFRAFYKIPEGEMMVDVQCRVVERIETLRQQRPDQAICIVSHSDPIKAILTYYGGIAVNSVHGFKVSCGSVSILDLSLSSVAICALNYTGHLF